VVGENFRRCGADFAEIQGKLGGAKNDLAEKGHAKIETPSTLPAFHPPPEKRLEGLRHRNRGQAKAQTIAAGIKENVPGRNPRQTGKGFRHPAWGWRESKTKTGRHERE